MGFWKDHDSQVFSGTKSTSWENLDISSIVGSTKALVKLGVKASAAVRVAFRPDTATEDYYHGDSSPHGCFNLNIPEADKEYSIDVLSHTTGVLEWRTNSSSPTVTVRVIGSCPTTIGESAIGTYSMTSGYTDRDISSIVGAKRSLNIIRYRRTAGTFEPWSARPNGDAKDRLVGSSYNNGVAQGLGGATSRYDALMVATDSSGIYEDRATSGLGMTAETRYLSGETEDGGYRYYNTEILNGSVVFADGDSSDDSEWTEIDIPAGLTKAMLLLSVEAKNGTVLDSFSMSFKDGADTADWAIESASYFPGDRGTHQKCFSAADPDGDGYVTVKTSNGKIKYFAHSSAAEPLDEQVIIRLHSALIANDPPTLEDESPTGTAEPYNVSVTFAVADDWGVNSATLNVDFEDPDAVTHNVIVNGVFQAGYSGTLTTVGTNLEVAITTSPPFWLGQWTVSVDVDDIYSENLTDSWNFSAQATPASTVIVYEPRGPQLVEPTTIQVIVEGIVELDLTTLEIWMLGPTGTRDQLVLNGNIQAGHNGTLRRITSPKHQVQATLDWPTVIPNGERWSVTVDVETSTGGYMIGDIYLG